VDGGIGSMGLGEVVVSGVDPLAGLSGIEYPVRGTIYIPSRARGRVCVPLNGEYHPLNRYNMTNKWAILGTIIYRVLPITCSRL